MQIDNQAEPVSDPLSTASTQSPFDLNGLTLLVQGTQAEQQAVALRKAFPAAKITTAPPQPIWRRRTRTEIAIYVTAALSLMIVGHLLFSYFTLDRITVLATSVKIEPEFFYFLMAGFVAQMIDGALGMAYGVTATTFLMSVGISPLHATASVHSSEIFTSGVSGYMHLKFGNINSKLFKAVLIPGVIGAALGAWVISELSSFEQYAKVLQPIISVYTAFLGILIIRKALVKRIEKKPIKKIGLLAWT
ncbi:MAG: sulfite exporter TauE/SafE family protein, partial [Cytophagaceae bacterium]